MLQAPAIWKKMYNYDQHLYGGSGGARPGPSLALVTALVSLVSLVNLVSLGSLRTGLGRTRLPTS